MNDALQYQKKIETIHQKLKDDAEAGGYRLNPDIEFARELIEGLLTNEERYGYWACPCRLAAGIKNDDLDIICPCDYRDVDLTEHGACYCGLYVSQEVIDGEIIVSSIPERRPPKERRKDMERSPAPSSDISSLPYPVWRCKVCGYLCARNAPPEICPVCKAKKERFVKFIE